MAMKQCFHGPWTEIRRVYSPPPYKLETENASGPGLFNLMQQSMFGVTTIELRCEACLDLKHSTAIGDLTRTLTTAQASWCPPTTRKLT